MLVICVLKQIGKSIKLYDTTIATYWFLEQIHPLRKIDNSTPLAYSLLWRVSLGFLLNLQSRHFNTIISHAHAVRTHCVYGPHT